ncbi:putative apolipoprotein N-acyltransferase [Bordetella bronchiseptica MO211]|nr:putative apolipoprotein N-acyltransferase [Bordetella bronchiseptica MO211]
MSPAGKGPAWRQPAILAAAGAAHALSGVIPVAVQGMTGLTQYARFGDNPALALIGLLLIAAAARGRRPRQP